MPKRVLMIDDSLPLHRIVEARLRGDDVELHSAVDGETGLSVAGQLRPSVILLDVDLPDMDGFEVCRRLKANEATAAIPVIFLTADGTNTNRQAGMKLGAFDFVAKPFRSDELSARVKASIQSRWQSEQAAGVDTVTGLWTRSHLEHHLKVSAGRSDGPTACVVADVDGMRLINARHGNVFGDEVLRSVGQVFLTQCRTERAVCSAGGGKFGIILAGSDRRAGRQFAEGLRDAIADRPVAGHQPGLAVTCSFGIADTVVSDDAKLVGRAEAALARAKRAGPGHISVARLPRQPLAVAA